VLNDLVNAFKQWLRTPVVTAVALASLGLGIGANVALFGLVDTLLLRSLPVRDPGSLIRLGFDDTHSGTTVEGLNVATPVWQYVRDQQTFAESVFVTANDRVNLARGGEARYVPALFVSGGALDILGVSPTIGRPLLPEDDRPEAPPTAMISHGLWQREYSGQASVIGQTIFLNDQAHTIVGVTPPSFFGLVVGQGADVVIPVSAEATLRRGAGLSQRASATPWLTLYGRLRPGQSMEDATALIRGWSPELRDGLRGPVPVGEKPGPFMPYAAAAGRGESYLRSQYERPLLVLLAAVALVLLIACANLAALVLARFTDRHHELGVRLALGAGRGRLIRMLVAESLLLSVAGAAMGLWFADAAVTAVMPYLSSNATQPADLRVVLDSRLLAFTVLLALASGVASGLIPAWRASRVSPQVSLASSARGGLHSRRAARSMRFLVAAQVALSLVLVAGASVMVRSFITLTANATGVDPDRVLIARVAGTLAGNDAGTRFERIEQIRQLLSALPGVEAVSAGSITPLGGSMFVSRVEVPGSLVNPASKDGAIRLNGRSGSFSPFNQVLPGFFRTVGTPIVAGRDFDERDGPGAPPVAIVNRAFAARHFGDGQPLGRTIIVNGKTLEIVGVVADTSLMTLKETAPIALAFGVVSQVMTTGPISGLRFAMRSQNPESLRASAAAAIRQVDPRLTLEFRTMRDEAETSVNRERLMAWLAGLFATLGLAMAVIGLYGTFTYAVARRRAEIGIRMALGAARTDILRMVMREVVIVLAIGTVAGLAGAFASGRMLQSLLFSTSARDPWMLTLALTGVVGAAVLASLVPARRASRIDPMVALREE
jgi:putative ABC transport system permease protein